MREETLRRAFELLDVQYSYTKYTKKNGRVVPVHTVENERQEAYYLGMRTMLEVILTENYAEPGAIVRGIRHRFELPEAEKEG